MTAIGRQSPNIGQGVDVGGAGDQGMMFGYATDETEELMPMPIMLAHRLTESLSRYRKTSKQGAEWLRPDGKSQVSVRYEKGKPAAVETVVISTQHARGLDQKKLRDLIIGEVIDPVLPKEMANGGVQYHINPTGLFEIGGPQGDAGLTGRKIIVDTYGGWGRHGGGAFSGKDPSKVDRSACYAARWVAKNIVAAGLASRCEVQVAYAIGVAKPVSVMVDTFGTSKVAEEKIDRAVQEVFDLTPAAIIKALDLRKPIYNITAAYGHFGRAARVVETKQGRATQFSWERCDRVEQLREAVA
jgi:S-adenosylmethionine synthetase